MPSPRERRNSSSTATPCCTRSGTEPWGQTVARILTEEGAIGGLSYRASAAFQNRLASLVEVPVRASPVATEYIGQRRLPLSTLRVGSQRVLAELAPGQEDAQQQAQHVGERVEPKDLPAWVRGHAEPAIAASTKCLHLSEHYQ